MIVCTACGTDNPDSAQACSACGNPIATASSAALLLSVGSTLRQGAYRVGKKLGQGGFALTYLGSETKVTRAVAIKEFFPSSGGCFRRNSTVCPGRYDPQAWTDLKRKFLSEADSLGKLSHPGIVRVYDSFEENDTAYIVMEFVRGQTLDEIIEARGTIPERDALDWTEQAAQALDVVHRANMLHRDLKPQNMMLADRGIVLIDFGAAREFAAGLSKNMSQIMTPGYAPLEQYAARAKFGASTDIYALAATLYHLLTNAVPTSATDRANGVDLDPPIKLNAKISRSTNDAILWAMEMRTPDRPQTVLEFLKALRGQPTPKRTPVTPAKVGSASNVLKFKSGVASSIAELTELCDRYPDEAEDYLFNGYIEKWLAQLGQAALAQSARSMTNSYRNAHKKGLELFVREVCQAAGLDPWPVLAAQPPQVDLGQLPIGARTAAQTRLKNQGRGYAWGKVELQPPIPGVSVPAKFDGSHSQLDFSVDLASAQAGMYQSALLVQAEGAPATLQITVRLEVVPLSATVDPAALHFGGLAFGAKATAQVRLTNQTPGGRFLGQASLSPSIPGVSCTGKVDGPSPDVTVAVDTGVLEAGKSYSATLTLATNAGTFTVPIHFSTTIAWQTVWTWAGSCALLAAGALGGLRALVGSTLTRQGAWVLDYQSAGPDLLLLCGILSAIPVGWLGTRYYMRKKRKK